MKKIYFVRHGETGGNVGGYWQGPQEPLNPRGLQQADVVAMRAQGLTVNRLVASTMVRAQQTAAAIGKSINVAVESSDLFREIKDPSSVSSDSASLEQDVLIESYRAARKEHINEPDFRFEDEETATEFFERIKAALEFLRELPEENIMVVSHGNFLRSMIGLIIQEGKYLHTDMMKFNRQITTTNTGITVVVLENNNFRLLTWNDHAHFAE